MTILAVAAAVALLYFGRVFFITMVVAITIAFLLDPLVTPFLKLRMPRPVASFIVCSVALLAFVSARAGTLHAILRIRARTADLQPADERVGGQRGRARGRCGEANLPGGDSQTISGSAATARSSARPRPARRRRGSKAGGRPVARSQIPEVRIHTEPTPLLTYLYGYIRSFYDVLLMASFVPFLVYFMLSWRDHMRRSFLYLFSGSERQIVGKSWQGVADMVRAYVIGNFILGLMLATISCSFFFAIRLPVLASGGPVERLPESGAVRRPAAGNDSRRWRLG